MYHLEQKTQTIFTFLFIIYDLRKNQKYRKILNLFVKYIQDESKLREYNYFTLKDE